MEDLQQNRDNRLSGKIGTDTMRKKMGEVLDCVYFKGSEFIIERKAKPLAVLVPISKYNAINRLAKEWLVSSLSARQNEEISQQQANDLANEAKHQVQKK